MQLNNTQVVRSFTNLVVFFGLTLGLCTQISAQTAAPSNENTRPNILLIVADDLGYTDLGAYGSEIDTPNLDQLASEGLILTGFHNQAVCAPTRAAILSGTDNHNAGGAMHQATNQRGMPGYESYLNEDVVPFSTLLQESGYQTYWAGKWHLGSEPHQTPNARGFDRSFALMPGFASHWYDRAEGSTDRLATYVEDGQIVESLPEDFYSSNFYTDYIMDSIKADADSGEPWLAFLGFTAPHWPLQAPDEDIAKYKDYYDEGYEALRLERIAAGKSLGVIPEEANMYPLLERLPAWEELSAEEKTISSKEMEIYAAMVDILDRNVGRLIDYLKETNQYDNTFIAFISDNGAEGQDRGGRGFDNSLENMGRINSYVAYGAEWAQASVGVMRYYKSLSSEGGTRGPAILNYPNGGIQGEISDTFASVVDLAPTFLQLAGVQHPGTSYNNQPIKPLQGHSLVPLVTGQSDTVWPDDFVFGWEVLGHLAIRKGDWKLLRLVSDSTERGQRATGTEGADYWGLYNMKTDPGETNNLSDKMPEKVEELLVAWEQYSAEHGLIVPVVEGAAGGPGTGGPDGVRPERPAP